jgi:hypothetical protein
VIEPRRGTALEHGQVKGVPEETKLASLVMNVETDHYNKISSILVPHYASKGTRYRLTRVASWFSVLGESYGRT